LLQSGSWSAETNPDPWPCRLTGRLPSSTRRRYSVADASCAPRARRHLGRALVIGDVAELVVGARAADFGKRAHGKIEALEADRGVMEPLRSIWVEAGLRMALKGADGRLMTADELAQSETIPKICIVGPPQGAGHIAVRCFTPRNGHRSMAVSGGCWLAAGALIPRAMAHGSTRGLSLPGVTLGEVDIAIENPAGVLEATIEARLAPRGWRSGGWRTGT
jgi:4-oxalomesaconate tautomerase